MLNFFHCLNSVNAIKKILSKFKRFTHLIQWILVAEIILTFRVKIFNPVVKELQVLIDFFTGNHVDLIIKGHDHKRAAEV